jgi:ribosome recycling factor
MNDYIKNKEEEFSKAIEFFKKDISSVKVGRANPSIFDGVLVEAYGVKNPINAVANVSVSDASSIILSPWDKNVSKDIERALVKANLGVGVINEGDKIRVTIPQMTEENRLESVKKVNEKQEKAKISVRQIREDVKNSIEDDFDNKEIGEDDKFRFIKELDERVSEINKEIQEIRERKEKNIMEI